MRSSLTITAIVAACISFSHEADATPPYRWSINGASCVPGDPAIQNNRVFITAGAVNHQAAATGLITMYCPVMPFEQPPLGTVLKLSLTYSDSNGTTTGANVTAQLIRLSKSNGGFSTVSSVINSDSSTSTNHNLSISFTHTLDWTNYVYYVRVDLNRSSTSDIEIFYAVDLEA